MCWAAVAGLLIAIGEMSRRRLACLEPCRVYIEFIRGTPTLTQLFLIYFGLPRSVSAIPGFAAAVIALGLHYAAYMAEIYRSGIAAVDRGQREAAQAIGMTRAETHALHHPAAVGPRRPAADGEPRDLAAEGHLDRLTDCRAELMLRANDITAENYMPMQLYIVAGVIYFIMAYPLSLWARYLERLARRGYALIHRVSR